MSTCPAIQFHHVRSIRFSPIRHFSDDRQDPFVVRDLIIDSLNHKDELVIFKIPFFGMFSSDLIVTGDLKPPLVDTANNNDRKTRIPGGAST